MQGVGIQSQQWRTILRPHATRLGQLQVRVSSITGKRNEWGEDKPISKLHLTPPSFQRLRLFYHTVLLITYSVTELGNMQSDHTLQLVFKFRYLTTQVRVQLCVNQFK